MKYIFSLLCCISAFISSAQQFVVGEYTYAVDESGQVSIFEASKSLEGIVHIPSDVMYQDKSYTVTSIDPLAFFECDKITQVYVPNSIIQIGKGAFKNCSALKYFEVQDGETPIVILSEYFETPFKGCPLQTLYIGRNQGTSSRPWDGLEFEELIIGPGMTELPYQSFANPLFKEIRVLYSEKDLAIGRDKTFNSGLLEKCNTLKKGYIDRRLSYEDRNTSWRSLFHYIPNLEYLEIGSHMTYVQADLATSCYKLNTVVLPEIITHIYDNAFAFSCLKSININNSLEYIGGGAFTMAQFDYFEIPTSVTSMGSQPFWQSDIKSAKVPGSLKDLPFGTFSNCGQLNHVILEEGIENLNDWTFNCCYSLNEITLPSSTKSIGSMAFNICTSLSKITCLAVEPPVVSQETFEEEQFTDIIIEVPESSLDLYKSASVWRNFKRIKAIPSTSVESISFENKTLIRVFDLMGLPVSNPKSGNIYIYEFSDGTRCKQFKP